MENDMMEMLHSMKQMEERELYCNHLVSLRNDFTFSEIEEWLMLSDYNEAFNGKTIH